MFSIIYAHQSALSTPIFSKPDRSLIFIRSFDHSRVPPPPSVVAANRQHVAARQRRQTAKTRAVDANAVVAHSAEASAVRQRAMAWLTLCAGGGAIAHFKRWSNAVIGARIMRRIRSAHERSVKIILKLLRSALTLTRRVDTQSAHSSHGIDSFGSHVKIVLFQRLLVYRLIFRLESLVHTPTHTPGAHAPGAGCNRGGGGIRTPPFASFRCALGQQLEPFIFHQKQEQKTIFQTVIPRIM